MSIRRAASPDKPAIRDVARRSLQASYSLGPHAITSAIEEWYGEDRLDETLSDDGRVLLVAVEDEQVVGFSESTLAGAEIGTLLWLHVDPAYRGHGIASELFEATRTELESLGAERIHGRVLSDNADGNAFYRSKGFEPAGEETVEIDGRTYVEQRYVETSPSGREPIETDGTTVFVDHDATEKGSVDAFHLVYRDQADSDLYGYYCVNCSTLANAMDAMGRIECDNCGNVRKPTRWDAAYL
ncbi:GNAT family N-acetyltransferase [Halomicrobium sp. HM KBTZ05]|uniref:GNAT family N-acetyltransferase n=1 Tax=Halomicrobium mukohataei TaxID=57705 RepID=A0A847UJT2_9EURY|nr:GNAT family N-acetyltransferase [Halomicrobium mukohataei]NLV11378.1 GNAT family N-acetyltransferase [Halomicrobium mukohataei]